MPHVELDWKISLAAILSGLQLIVMLCGGIVTVLILLGAQEAEKQQVAELKTVTTTIQSAQNANAVRVGSLETSIKFIASSVQRLEAKLDASHP